MYLLNKEKPGGNVHSYTIIMYVATACIGTNTFCPHACAYWGEHASKNLSMSIIIHHGTIFRLMASSPGFIYPLCATLLILNKFK